MQYLVVIEKGSSSFGGYVPDLPGCVAVGETRAEVTSSACGPAARASLRTSFQTRFGSPVHVVRLVLQGKSMKKIEDEMRAQYKRSDFSKLERGKFYKQVARGTPVVLLQPKLAKAFPTSEAVNEALRGLLTLMEQTSRITGASSGRSTRRRVV